MGQALYRKYRSKKLSEIVGQDHITRTLERAIKHGKISHAYLFTGPRGVGKTSVARILAHEINGLSYTDESMHLDIIEIDAASNRRIDEIRELRDKVHIAPTSGKYKVYIIDEVHMLTKEAFNALLKTLEEPPAHVIFILATTELHKLPETIISRTQRFTFKPIGETDAVKHLKQIAESEGLQVDEEALRLLARHGRGSFRDSISLLDQVGHSKNKITRKDAERLVGIAAGEHIKSLLQAALSATPADIIKTLDQLTTDGIGPAQTAKQLSALLRQDLIENGGDKVKTNLLGDLISVSASQEPAGQLEVALFKANLAQDKTPNVKHTFKPKAKETNAEELNNIEPEKPAEKEHTTNSVRSENYADKIIDTKFEKADWWNDVLKDIKSVNNTLYGMLRMAEAEIEKDTLHLKFGFLFHKKKAEDSANQTKLHQAMEKVTGKSYKINVVHDANINGSIEPPASIDSSDQQVDNNGLTSVTNVFGGGEVLES